MRALSLQLLTVVLIGALLLLLAMEGARPFRRAAPAVTVRRWGSNLLLTAMELGVVLQLAPWLAWGVIMLWHPAPGLLQRMGASPWLSFGVLLVVLQLQSYWLHRLSHAWHVLWRFHAVHHSDTEMDVTTAHRHHPVEVLISALVVLPLLLALGPDPWSLLAYNLLHIVVSMAAHSNLSWGPWGGWMRWLVLTPGVHRLHHSADPRFTNSNYATMLPVMDWLFRTATYRPLAEQAEMPLGLEYFRAPADNGLWRLLALPFARWGRSPPSSAKVRVAMRR